MKLLSILLSLLVLLSTSSVTLDVHYCSDKLQDFSFNNKVTNCSGKLVVEIQEFAGDTCCLDKTIQKDAQKDLKASSNSFEFQSFLSTVPYTFGLNTPLPDREEISSYFHKPPLIKKDYQVLFEVFLI